MKLYKYETHLHTSQGSKCSWCSGAEQVENLKRCGYSGCFVTDHFFNGNTAVDRGLPWDVKVNLFCQGYEDAKRRGGEIGIDVFFGWEYCYHGTEFLTYGLGKEFLLDYPQINEMELNAYAALVHRCGGFIVHAHPFREAGYLNTIRLYPRIVDGVEAENASHLDPKFNDRAMEYALSYSIPVTGGSDTHEFWDFPGGGIEVSEKINSPADYLRLLRSGGITRILTRTDEYMTAQPPEREPVRPDISLLPSELRKKAEDYYKLRSKIERKQK